MKECTPKALHELAESGQRSGLPYREALRLAASVIEQLQSDIRRQNETSCRLLESMGKANKELRAEIKQLRKELRQQLSGIHA